MEKEIEIKSQLTERQLNIYETLKTWASNNPNQYVSKETIVFYAKQYFGKEESKDNEHNSTIYSQLRKDITMINLSGAVEKIIISSPKGYKLATSKDESEKYLERLFKKYCRGLSRYWNLIRKVRRDGQAILNDVEAKPDVIATFELTEDGNVRVKGE